MERSGIGRGDRGQASVELVLVLPFIVLLVLAILQVTLLGVERIAVVNAAREAQREAAVNGDVDDIREAAVRAVPDSGAAVEVTVRGERKVGEHVRVEVRHATRPRVPVVAALFPDVIDLGAEVSMRVEKP